MHEHGQQQSQSPTDAAGSECPAHLAPEAELTDAAALVVIPNHDLHAAAQAPLHACTTEACRRHVGALYRHPCTCIAKHRCPPCWEGTARSRQHLRSPGCCTETASQRCKCRPCPAPAGTAQHITKSAAVFARGTAYMSCYSIAPAAGAHRLPKWLAVVDAEAGGRATCETPIILQQIILIDMLARYTSQPSQQEVCCSM